MDTSLVVLVLLAVYLTWPCLESDTHLMTTGPSRPWEDALRIEHRQMVHWIYELLGPSTTDSYQVVSRIVESPIANVPETTYTAGCKVSKDLCYPVAMRGCHREMRQLVRP